MSQNRDNFFSPRPVEKARKAHVCVICRREIPAGSSYTRVGVANLGERTSHAMHDDCLAAALEAQAPTRTEACT